MELLGLKNSVALKIPVLTGFHTSKEKTFLGGEAIGVRGSLIF